jgi:hypothetical protein
MQAPLPPGCGQIAPEGKSRDGVLALALCGVLLLFAGLFIAGATHNVRSPLIPIGIVVCLTGLACTLTGGILYIARGRGGARHSVQ